MSESTSRDFIVGFHEERPVYGYVYEYGYGDPSLERMVP
jgi:hypothetical protein